WLATVVPTATPVTAWMNSRRDKSFIGYPLCQLTNSNCTAPERYSKTGKEQPERVELGISSVKRFSSSAHRSFCVKFWRKPLIRSRSRKLHTYRACEMRRPCLYCGHLTPTRAIVKLYMRGGAAR